jgi:hypothetical protein
MSANLTLLTWYYHYFDWNWEKVIAGLENLNQYQQSWKSKRSEAISRLQIVLFFIGYSIIDKHKLNTGRYSNCFKINLTWHSTWGFMARNSCVHLCFYNFYFYKFVFTKTRRWLQWIRGKRFREKSKNWSLRSSLWWQLDNWKCKESFAIYYFNWL